MTRLRIPSDLHLDTPNLQNIAAINQGDEDIVVCAGDVMNKPIGGKPLGFFFRVAKLERDILALDIAEILERSPQRFLAESRG
jgi:hypothetical protein